ncbi:MAG TPA: AbrB/MazE/SpoVT family DNA-binding domain-containing protein, partial [Candidatus Kapabacteria bacterium]|nr:AbrB/MazE/SpoVT family DNA-binding domain-containing protein [Candidatus Kapabacteria bacterium]
MPDLEMTNERPWMRGSAACKLARVIARTILANGFITGNLLQFACERNREVQAKLSDCSYLLCRYIIDMTALVQKWGNSLAVRLPKAVADQIEVSEGQKIQMRVDGNSLVIKA